MAVCHAGVLGQTGKVLYMKRWDIADVRLKSIVDSFVKMHSVSRRRIRHRSVSYDVFHHPLCFDDPVWRRRLGENRINF